MNDFLDPAEQIKQPLNMAIAHLSYQPRTIYQMQEYIKKKGFSEDIALEIIQILVKKNYLNDENFARLFVETKVKYKAKSKFAFRYDLKKKGICSSIIDKILLPYDDQDLAFASVRRKIKTWQTLDVEKFKKKMTGFLRYRGFTYDVCRSTVNHFITSKQEIREDINEN
ncbi:RecX family transcriptional regulator [Desulfobacula sp.]|uniref:regulatory protein RecX n=1 Tax=Desulfobacula sp. TaxID=2593537 RepID=UPI002630CAE4|nr:RecX family transcriptional regulator [Desulfobacula sp.]